MSPYFVRCISSNNYIYNAFGLQKEEKKSKQITESKPCSARLRLSRGASTILGAKPVTGSSRTVYNKIYHSTALNN